MSILHPWIVVTETALYAAVDRISRLFADGPESRASDPLAPAVTLHGTWQEDVAACT